MKSFSYSNERDKAYGVAGMTICLIACDNDRYLASVDMDAAPGESMCMNHDFGMRPNPRMSAKIVWAQAIDELRVSASMALANLVCRRYVMLHRGLNSDEVSMLKQAVTQEAAEGCALEPDEAERLYSSCYQMVDRIFRHTPIHQIAGAFADELIRRRSLSAAEARDTLASLGLR